MSARQEARASQAAHCDSLGRGDLDRKQRMGEAYKTQFRIEQDHVVNIEEMGRVNDHSRISQFSLTGLTIFDEAISTFLSYFDSQVAVITDSAAFPFRTRSATTKISLIKS